jgi:hypothetical protein
MISLLNANGHKLLLTGSGFSGVDGGILSEDLLAPKHIKVEDFNSNAEDILRPAFDEIWQAADWPKSPYYDKNGNRLKAAKSNHCNL